MARLIESDVVVHSGTGAGGRLEIDAVTKTFGRLTALDAVSFEIERGEILGVIGPNGAGKTTLFECVAGLLPMDRGQVRLDGRALDDDTRSRALFYVPDGIAPWPSQPFSWALDFTAGFFGGSPAAREDVVGRLGLTPLLRTPLPMMSKGQRKRALLALGLIAPQPWLLIDEPFDGLDLRQTREVAATLASVAGSGRTLLLSIHQIADAARLCDRFVLLSAGRVCGTGRLDDLAALAAARGATPDGKDLEEIFLALT